MSLDEKTLEELERLDREACPAPWRVHERGLTILTSQSHPLATLSDPGHRQILDGRGRIRAGNDGELIVAARNAIPSLLAEVRRLRSEREALLRELDRKAADARAYWGERDEAREALRLLLTEVEASGNGNAKDFGWPKALDAARKVLGDGPFNPLGIEIVAVASRGDEGSGG